MCENDKVKPSVSGKMLDQATWDALRKAGVPQEELEQDQPFGPVIFAYTRKQAIEDGVLIDVTEIARLVGFKIHTVVTCGVMEAATAVIRKNFPEDFQKYPLYKVQASAMKVVLCLLFAEIRKNPHASDRLDFQAFGEKLYGHIGPGDDGEAVLTVMLDGED